VLTENEGLSKEKICDDLFTALRYNREYGFPSTAFVKAAGTVYEEWEISTHGSSYDVDSIVRYYSAQGESTKCSLYIDVEECPLVKYKEPGNSGTGVEMISKHHLLSDGDVMMIKKLFPWRILGSESS
jgi:hypothetical protein